jgi:plastocyanin domain-containing protein
MKPTIAAVIIAFALISAVIIVGKNNVNNPKNNIPVNNVGVVGDRQVIEITAKGGFTPRKSTAKAGTPTTLRINTEGTFDCSSSVRIPSMNVFQNLPPSGVTDIDLGIQPLGVLSGTCGMGMYPFEIDFQ